MKASLPLRVRSLTILLSILILIAQLGIPSRSAQAASSNSVAYIHDQAGRLVGVVDSANAAVYKYDSVGNVLSITRYASTTVSIIQMTPSSATVGTQVIIYGTAFSATPSQNTVTFNGTAAVVASSSGTQIVTSVPSGATTGTVQVVSPNGSASSSSAFTVTASVVPTITSFTPTVGKAGTAVAVSGTNFQTTLTNNDALFNTTHAIVNTASATSLSTAVPNVAGSGHLTVRTPNGTATSAGDFYIPPLSYTASQLGPTGRVSYGDTKTFSFSTAGQIGMFLFDGTGGSRFSINMSLSMGACCANVYVFNPNGSILVPQTVVGTAFFSDALTEPFNGTYALLVDPGNTTGSITFSLYNVPPDVTTTITEGGPSVTVANTVPGQNMNVTFSGTAGDAISLNVTMNCCLMSLSISNPDGTTLVPPGLGGYFFIDKTTLTQTGTYTIALNPDGASVLQATLTLYKVPPDATATLTEGGSTVSVSNTVPGQNIAGTFSGTAGDVVSATVSISCAQVSTTIYNPDGTTLLASTPGCYVYLDRTTLQQTGTYKIYVDPAGAALVQANMTVYRVPPDATGTITIGGPSVTISNSVPGQNMLLTFSGTTGKTINLTSGLSPCGIGSLAIYNPDGTALFGPQGFPGCLWGIGPFTLPQTGTYTIYFDPSGATIQSVQETLTDPPAASRINSSPSPISSRTSSNRPPSRTTPPAPKSSAQARRSAPVPADAVDRIAGPEYWPPDPKISTADWTAPRNPYQAWLKLPALRGPPGVTALAGQVLKLNGAPLKGVTLSIGDQSTRSDETGRFLLTNLSAGTQVLFIDGRTASEPGHVYGVFEDRVDVVAGKTTALDYTIWMTKLDQKDAVSFPSPTTKETVITTPEIPGLEVRLPAGTVIKDSDGKVVTQLSITAIPVNRPPFPLPAGVYVPLYFTVQPGSSYIFPKGAQIIYPNYTHLAPGARANFWDYDPDQKGWYIYGHGTVTPDGKQVVPDPGVVVWEFTGAMLSPLGYIAALFGPILKGFGIDGDPVDLQTGLFVLRKVDLALPDTMPLTLTRTYRPGDKDSNGNYITRDFGIGTTNSFNMYLVGASGQYQYADLMMPDGGKVHFVRISSGTGFADAVFQAKTTPSEFYLSKIVYNGNGWTLTMKNGTQYIFGDNAPLQAIRDRHGNQITISRPGGPNTNITQVSSSNGRWIAFTYDSSNRIAQAQDNLGQTVTYTYDANGNLWKVTDPNGGVTTYTYDANHNMLTLQDGRSITFLTNSYDSNGRISKQTQADQTTYQFSYVLNSSNQVTEADVTDPRGIKRKVTFNSDGYLLTDTNAVGATEQQTVSLTRQSGTDLTTGVTDALNRMTSFGYDATGNLTSVTQLAGTSNAVTTQFTYEPTYNQLKTVTDPLNHTTMLGYDASGNLTTVADPLQNQTVLAYNYFGQPTSIKDPLNNVTQLQYSFGDPSASVDALGNTTKYFIDGGGRPILTTDPLGDTVTVNYDVLNRPTQVINANGSATNFTYDQNSNLKTVVDARSNTTSYAYDTMDRLSTRTDPLQHAESYVYDQDGNLTQFTDRRGQIDVATYDNLNRTTFVGFAKTVNNKGVASYQSTTNYSYDAGDRLTKVLDSVAGTITPVFDNLDRITSETTPQGQVTYGYDSANRRTSMQVAAQSVVSYSYDNANRLTSITQGAAVATPAYDVAGRLSSLTLPNGVVVTYGYNASSQLTTINYAKGTTSLGDLEYSYDAAGQRAGVSGAFARTNFPAAVTTATYNADNQLTAWGSTKPTYDANGNMTSDGTNTYSWDARNQLSSLSKGKTTNSFQYDAFGRRTQKTIGGTTTGYLYDGANPVQELSGTTSTANMLTGLGVDQYLIRTDSAGARDFLPDALGSTVALTDSTGAVQTSYTYEAFGNSTASGQSSTSSYQFTGRENDGTGLDYYRARYYNPTFQRFVSEDQMGFAAGDPNLYEYAAGTPTDATDPSGNFVQVILGGCLVGATIAGFIDDVKLANAERKGREGPSFGQFVGDIVKGCVAGAVIATVGIVADVFAGWVAGDALAEGGAVEEEGALYHYTTADRAEQILSDGQINPSSNGYTYLTPDRYAEGSTAESRLALSTQPDGYIRVPAPAGAPEPTVVPPGNGQPGGGLEVPIRGPITLPPGSAFRRF